MARARKNNLAQHFYIAMLWGGLPLKVVEDALMMVRRAG
jgi:hypothetical protein